MTSSGIQNVQETNE